jgi:hypothetical protein
MNSRIKHYLELIRLPAMFTAQADILAAWIIIGRGIEPALLWLLLATSSLISAGMVLNDYFDYEIDYRERPQRPLPSGRIRRTTALRLGISLILFGLFSAFMAGFRPFGISLILVCAIFLYDGVYKDLPVIGPFFMGSCRYFNLLMGLSVSPFEGWALVPLITGSYVFGVTVLSQKETVGGRAFAHIGFCAAAVGSVFLWIWFLFINQTLPHVAAVILSLFFAVALARKVTGLLDRNRPEDFQKTVKVLLICIIFLDAVISAGFAPLYKAVLILLLLVPAKLSVKLFKVT